MTVTFFAMLFSPFPVFSRVCTTCQQHTLPHSPLYIQCYYRYTFANSGEKVLTFKTRIFPILPRLTAYLHASFLREIRQSYTAPHSLRLPSSFPFFLPQFKNVKFILPSQTLLPRRNTFTSSRFQPWLQPHLLPGNTVPIHPC